MNNPGRYLAIGAADERRAAASGSPSSPRTPSEPLYQWDTQLDLQWMPRTGSPGGPRPTYRHSDVPYWSGGGGVTPRLATPARLQMLVCNNGSAAGGDSCANEGGLWYPDLRTREVVWGAGVLVRF